MLRSTAVSAPRLAARALALAATGLLAPVLAACADPTVSVAFHPPTGAYQDLDGLISAVDIEVLAFPDDPAVTCTDVALGNVDHDAVAAALEDQVTVTHDEPTGALTRVPRTGSKLFVARALSADNQLVAAGCTEKGTIDGDAHVDIDGQPAVVVSARDTVAAGPLRPIVQLAASDALGRPMAGVTASYRIVGANSDVDEPDVVSDADGTLNLTIDLPAQFWYGPEVVDVDVPWQANQLAPIAGFRPPPAPRFAPTVPDAAQTEPLAPAALYQLGHVGPDGQPGIAMLGRLSDPQNLASDRPLLVWYAGGGSLRQAPGFGTATVKASAVGLVERGGSSGDQVVAMNALRWYARDPADGAVTSTALSNLVNADRMIPIGTCEPGEPRDHVVVSSSGGMALYAGDGSVERSSQLELESGAQLIEAGCVRGLDSVYPAVVYSATSPQGDTRIRVAADLNDSKPATWATVARGVAFTPELTDPESGAPVGPFLLGNRFEIDGTSLARFNLVPGVSGQLGLDLIDQDDLAGTVLSSTAGDFDGDGLLDVAALILVVLPDRSTEIRTFVALGQTVEGVRLAGISDASLDVTDIDARLMAADLAGEGHDQLIVAARAGPLVFDLEPTR